MTNQTENTLAPICLFVYNRPKHTYKTLLSLSKCKLADQSKLFIFADGPKHGTPVENLLKIAEVRRIIKLEKWCKELKIIESEKNKGLANSIIAGVSDIVKKYGKVIVVEDDLDLSSGFLEYMNNSLNFYQNEEKVMHIAGFTPSVKKHLPETFFFPVPTCWGWATWDRAWKHFNPSAQELLSEVLKKGKSRFDFNRSINYVRMLRRNVNKKVDSWFIRWYASIFLMDGLCLHPGKSLVYNTGLDHSGVNSYKSDVFNTEVSDKIKIESIPLELSEKAIRAYTFFNWKVKLIHLPEYAWRVITRTVDT